MSRKTQVPDGVDAESRIVNDRFVWRFYALYGKRRRRITEGQYKAILRRLNRQAQVRGRALGGKRGAGEAPGAGHCWPMKCEALAVHPDQVEQMNERNRRHGVNVQYEPKHGLAIIPDAAAYKRLRRLERCHFNNSYND